MLFTLLTITLTPHRKSLKEGKLSSYTCTGATLFLWDIGKAKQSVIAFRTSSGMDFLRQARVSELESRRRQRRSEDHQWQLFFGAQRLFRFLFPGLSNPFDLAARFSSSNKNNRNVR